MILQVDYQSNQKNSEITVNMITYAANQVYKEGIDGNSPTRRIFARLQGKLDDHMLKDSALELEGAEVDLISDLIKNTKFPPAWSKTVVMLEDALK